MSGWLLGQREGLMADMAVFLAPDRSAFTSGYLA
jgi:hypothetical protein